MRIPDPTEQDVADLAAEFRFDLDDADVRFYADRVRSALAIFDVVEQYDTTEIGPEPIDTSARDGTEPTDDRLNAWLTRCDIQTETTGPLADLTVAIKDGINVAGLESTSGSKVFEGAVPDYDATVVTRLLDAGARITGKTNMDDMGNSGDGSSSAFGAVLNPADDGHLAGGSSGGSAAAVADGQVDAALGTDSGGSIRAPAAWCGVVGHKPTRGLTPYTGISGLERTIDHVGPMAPTVETAARLLTVLAGPDPYDDRQPRNLPERTYENSLGTAAGDISIGVVEEGFTRPGSDDDLNDRVSGALDRVADEGADVDEVSVPIHADGQTIQSASAVLGMYDSYRTEGESRCHEGWYDAERMATFHERMRDRADEVPASVRHSLLLGAYVERTTPDPGLYGDLMNLRRLLERRYDEALRDHDVLALPTTPMPAYAHDPQSTREEWLDRSLVNLSNTAPFNATGHPAVNVPIGTTDGLPVGLQLVGSHFDDETVLDVAATVESVVGRAGAV